MEFSEQDKVTIASAMYDIIFDLEGAEAVLWAVQEVFFHDDQKDIPVMSAVTLGKLLRVYLGEIQNAIKAYKQIVPALSCKRLCDPVPVRRMCDPGLEGE